MGLVRLVVGFPWESSVRLVECLPDNRFVCSRLFSGSTAIFVVNSSVEGAAVVVRETSTEQLHVSVHS